MILYLLKFSVCLSSFILFFKLFLEKENMHHFKRFFLIGSVVFSFIIPLITFTSYIETQITPQFIPEIILETENFEVQSNHLPLILWSFYGFGVFILGLKFILNLYQLKNRISKNTKYNTPELFYVLLNEHIIPHTFFKYIFLNKQNFERNQIPREVIWHEETHALEKHSLDIIFIEILQILLWFNPLIYIQKHLIKMNHEFLADQAVINKGIPVSDYQQILLEFSQNTRQPQLTNAINYSFIKKRFNIMKTQKSKSNIWVRSFIMIPLIIILIYGFSNRNMVEINPTDATITKLESDIQEGVTKQQIAEYNKLVRSYHVSDKEYPIVKQKDYERMKHISDLMTPEQRKEAEPFPNFVPPPQFEAPNTLNSEVEILPPPPPMNKVKIENQSKELQMVYKKYSKEAESYAKGVGTYQKSKDDNEYTKLREQYKLVMHLYTKYKELADNEKDMTPPPPPPPKK